MDALLFEFWIASPLGKKILKGFTKILNGHLRGAFGDLQHPWELGRFHGIEAAPHGGFVWLFARRIFFLPLRKRPIIGESGATRCFCHIGLLLIIKFQRDLVRSDHDWSNSATLSITCLFLRLRAP